MEGSVSIQGQSASGNITQSFTVSNNHIVSNGVGQKELSSIDGRLDKFENSLEAIYAFMQKNTAIPNADAAEADVTMERQVRDTAFEIKDAVAELKKSPEITAEQEKRIDALNETVEKVIGRLKNSPTATLNEIAHISKTQSGSYAFRTLYDQDKVDFTTRTVSGGTLLSIVSPIKKDYLLTCRNLVPGKGEM